MTTSAPAEAPVEKVSQDEMLKQFKDRYAALIKENQDLIESDWDKTFGDCKNEIVFIGQDMNQEQIKMELDRCIMSDESIQNEIHKKGYSDEWPIERVYPLN